MPDTAPATDPAPTDTPAATPPWGSDEDFKPDKAWTLIEALRADKAELQTKLTTAEGERDTLKSEAQARLDDAKSADQELAEKLAETEKRASAAERALHVERALSKNPSLKGFEDLLVGDSEEAINAVADRLAAIGKPADGDPAPITDPAPEPAPAARPTPDLTPGHAGGEDITPFDPAAIAKAARRR